LPVRTALGRCGKAQLPFISALKNSGRLNFESSSALTLSHK
jgi:hypothetical protein